MGQRVLYGALWGSLLVCPLVRLPATHFIVSHFDRMAPPRLQRDMLGTDHRLVVRERWRDGEKRRERWREGGMEGSGDGEGERDGFCLS